MAITVEEHQKIGGLGGAVAELLSEKLPSPLLRIGVEDTFGESGKPDDLKKKYHMTSEDIIEAVRNIVRER